MKYARDRFAAELRPVGEARRATEDAAADSLTGLATGAAPAAHHRTFTLAARWQSSAVAATLLGIPGVTPVDSRTVRTGGTLPGLSRLFGVWTRVAAALTCQAPYC
ncbi:M55 family metallopeptidase [Streptomyces sp. NPDC059398]|uniref:M55 family metallopeptidase n=1 Tax=Streptomyces sp. NPDC059398 TaxID=3346820 RepID=UPI0036C739BF